MKYRIYRNGYSKMSKENINFRETMEKRNIIRYVDVQRMSEKKLSKGVIRQITTKNRKKGGQ